MDNETMDDGGVDGWMERRQEERKRFCAVRSEGMREVETVCNS